MAKAVPVLMYHHVSPAPGLVTVAPQNFDYQMRYLRDHGYAALRAREFRGFLLGETPVPPKSVLITFDDGFLDNYVFAYPILRQYGLHAVVFAMTSMIGEGPLRPHAGQKGAQLPATPDHRACKAALRDGHADAVMLRWSEIHEMEAAGVIEVHSHTHTHVRWDQRLSDPQERYAAVREDLVLSREALTKRLNKPCDHLCWPWGYTEPRYQDIAAELGFEVQYTTAKGVNSPGRDPRQVARIVVKDRRDTWFANRLWIYRHPWLGSWYSRIHG